MRQLSTWAKGHPIKARYIIIFSHLLLALLAYFIGKGLRDFKISFSSSLLFNVFLVFIAVALIYPHKKDKPVAYNVRYTYWFRKSCDFLAITCSFCLLCCLANNAPLAPVYDLYATTHSTGSVRTVNPTAEEILSSLKSGRDKKSLTRTEKRVLKKEFKHQLKVYAVAKLKGDPSAASQAILILLAIIAAVGVLYLVAALACSLSCSGNDAAAVLVAVVGLVGVIWLLVYVIRHITRPTKKDKPGTKDSAPSTS